MLRIPIALYLASILAASLGCSAGKDAPPGDTDLSVPECAAYAAKIAACFHRDDARESVVTVAATLAQRATLARTCTANLQRLNDACR